MITVFQTTRCGGDTVVSQDNSHTISERGANSLIFTGNRIDVISDTVNNIISLSKTGVILGKTAYD